MAFIEEAADACADERVARGYERQAAAFGYLPNYARLFSHRPEVLDLWAALLRGLRAHTSTRLFELVTFAAALALESSYCTLAHGTKLRAFFTDQQLVRLARGDHDGILSAAESAVWAFASKLASGASSVSAEDLAPLKASGYSDAEIFDIAAIAAGRAFFASLVDGLGALPDPAYAELPAVLKTALVVGRPIDSEEGAAPA